LRTQKRVVLAGKEGEEGESVDAEKDVAGIATLLPGKLRRGSILAASRGKGFAAEWRREG